MNDQYGRTINYMRISITDRCNLRCRYCMPEGCLKVSHQDILTYEEILVIVKAALKLGIDRFKITGGEPLVRPNCAYLIQSIKELPGVKEVTMTSNGIALKKYLPELMAAGLDAINISLDTLDAKRFYEITGGGDLYMTLEGIEAARKAGLKVKLNCLLMKDFNEDELFSLTTYGLSRGIDVRWIEMMPLGTGRNYRGIANQEILKRLKTIYPDLVLDQQVHGNGPAVYYHQPGMKAGIGLISAIHGNFCDQCNRIRLTAQGFLKPCLYFPETINVKHYLNHEDRLAQVLADVIFRKPQAHRFNKEDGVAREEHYMVQIGG